MLIAYCLYFVVFTTQLLKSMCHPNHFIHHLLPSDRKAKQNDKNQTFLHTILTTGPGVSRKLMTSLVWWLLFLLLLVPWSAWTVEASLGLSPFGSVFGHWCHISQIFATPLQNIINLSSCRSSRTTLTLVHYLTVDHLASCKYAWQLELPHSDCIHHCFFSLYNCSYLFISSSILSFHCQNTSVTPHLKCKCVFPSSLFTVHVSAAYCVE